MRFGNCFEWVEEMEQVVHIGGKRMKRKWIICLVCSLLMMLSACGNDEKNDISADGNIPFEEYYAGFHVVANSDYAGNWPDNIQVIADENDWNAWLTLYFPEIQKAMNIGSQYEVDWTKEVLLVHSTYPVTETATMMKLISEITCANDELSVVESEELVILPADMTGEGVHYYPYQIVKMERADVSELVLEKYEIELEATDTLEFSNVYMGFHSSKYGDYTNGSGQGVVGIITSEDGFDTWWRTYLGEIGEYVLNRAQPNVDWEEEIILIYHPRQQNSQIAELCPIEKIELYESTIVVIESTKVITMPVFEEVYEYSYQPYQIIKLSKQEIAQDVLDKYEIKE